MWGGATINTRTTLLVKIAVLCVIPIGAASQDDLVIPRDQSPWQIAMLVYRQHGGFEFTSQQSEFLQDKFDSSEIRGDYGSYFDESPLKGRYYPAPEQIANFYITWFGVKYQGDKQELRQAIIDYESIEVTQQQIDEYADPSLANGAIATPLIPTKIRSRIRSAAFSAKYPDRRNPGQLTTASGAWKGQSGYSVSYNRGFLRDHAIMGAWMDNVLMDFKQGPRD